MAQYTDGKRYWSNRYYCDHSTPCIYYDLEIYTSLDNIPDEANLTKLTLDQWNTRKSGQTMLSKYVVNGVLTDYPES